MITMVRSTRVEERAEMPCDDVIIRNLTKNDATLLGNFLYEAFKDSVHRDRWKSPQAAIREALQILADRELYLDASFVAINEDRCVSVSVVAGGYIGPFLTYVGTVAQYRRCGLAGELVKRSLKGMHSKGFIDVYLQVADKNKNAVSRYRSLGFEQIQLPRTHSR